MGTRPFNFYIRGYSAQGLSIIGDLAGTARATARVARRGNATQAVVGAGLVPALVENRKTLVFGEGLLLSGS